MHAHTHAHTQHVLPTPCAGLLDSNPFYLSAPCLRGFVFARPHVPARTYVHGRLCFACGCLWWRCQRELISCLLPSPRGDGVSPRARSDRCRPISLPRKRPVEGFLFPKPNFFSFFFFFLWIFLKNTICFMSPLFLVKMTRETAARCTNVPNTTGRLCRGSRAEYPRELVTLTAL